VPQKYLNKILNAPVYDVAIESPLDAAPGLSARIGNRVLIKREDLQPVFSFKLRGAYNKLVNLPEAARKKGVIAASAGNHAQGVALAAARMKVSATIVMPQTTPEIKVSAVRKWGAKVILHGDDFAAAYARALEIIEKKGLTLMHPVDDPDVIAGQGTVGMEILRQHMGDIHAIFLPIGGGGLAAGVAAYVKTIRPEIKIIGVEAVDSASMYHSLKKGRRVVLDQVGIFADGVAVAQVGKETFRLARKLIDEVVLVDVDQMCAAVKDLFDDTRAIAEPSGALAVAGMKIYAARKKLTDKTLIAVNSGANVNFDRLRHISERAEIGEAREALFAVTIPEVKGSFRKFCRILGKRSVTEFNYRYSDQAEAQIFVGVGLSEGDAERTLILKTLRKNGYTVRDLTENDMAKLHIRHMVGGQPGNIGDEQVYRFEFPERPGALMNFLTHMGERWNISLFHYRNHGSAFGRVLCGVQVPASDEGEFQSFLETLGYPSFRETENPAYRTFLN
jgi:threonine dehydratase